MELAGESGFADAPQIVKEYCHGVGKTLTDDELCKMRDNRCTYTIHPPNPDVAAMRESSGPNAKQFDTRPFHFPKIVVVDPSHFTHVYMPCPVGGWQHCESTRNRGVSLVWRYIRQSIRT